VGTNSSGQVVDASSATLANNTTGNAATATALAATPSLCATGSAPTGVLANGNATGCASIGSASAAPYTLCQWMGKSSANAGSTNATNVYNCAIPAGTMGANTRLHIVENATGGASNTGTCKMQVLFSGASGTTTTSGNLIYGSMATASGASTTTWASFDLWNSGSTAIQSEIAFGFNNNAVYQGTVYSSFTNNTATTEYYLNFNLTNSVSTDSCYFYGVSVELWPNG
jgi:hypothetical protein